MVLQNYLKHEKNKMKLVMIAVVSALVLPLLMLAAIAPIVRADGDGSPNACLDTSSNVLGSQGGSDNAESENSVTVDVGAGKVVSGVCIKSGSNMFNGNKHSDVLGNGTYETGCYTVTGVGTQSVTVTRNFETNACQGISHIDVVVADANQEEPTGALEVNKVLLNAAGAVTGGNTEANTLGFRWGFHGEGIANLMGSSEDGLDPDEYSVTENEVEGYDFVGYFLGEGSCAETEEDKTLPISVTVASEETTVVTLCNQEDEGEVLGDTDTTQGQVLGAQAVAAVGGVGAGGSGSIAGSLYGLGASLSAVGYGVASIRKRR